MKKCKICGKEFEPRYKSTEMFCSSRCAYEYQRNKNKKPKKPIKKVSVKQQKLNIEYKKLRFEYLNKPENQYCFVAGCGNRANTIEHRKGRKGYADEWAKTNNIPLLLDVRFWAPCCLKHNLEFENNPELSKIYQLSKLHKGKKL